MKLLFYLIIIFPLRVLNSETITRYIKVTLYYCLYYIPSYYIPIISCYSDYLNSLKRILYINEEIRIKYILRLGIVNNEISLIPRILFN